MHQAAALVDALDRVFHSLQAGLQLAGAGRVENGIGS